MQNWIKRIVIVTVLSGGFLAFSADEAEARHRRWRRCCRPVCCVSHCHSHHHHSSCCQTTCATTTQSYASTNCCTTGGSGYIQTGYHGGY
jgi:hypothetical protein